MTLINNRLTDRIGRAPKARLTGPTATTACIALALAVSAMPVSAQRGAEPRTLHGSKASVERMYDFAHSHGLTFYLTPANVEAAIAAGKLVPLREDSTYELARGVQFTYATREAKQFVEGLAPQYLAACGTPLTVTSAARPLSRQPRNANPHSVHPTGIAVDLRRPRAGPCLTWVRSALAELEARGIVEATEEHHPVHLHVAVLMPPGRTVAMPRLYTGIAVARKPVASHETARMASSGEVTLPSRSGSHVPTLASLSGPIVFVRPPSAMAPLPTTVGTTGRTSSTELFVVATPVATPTASPAAAREPLAIASGDSASRRDQHVYRVRQGDTLWDVARRTGVSVRMLAQVNNRSTRRALRPGDELKLPESPGR